MDMHRYSHETEALAQSMMRIALDRLRMDAPLDGPVDAQELGRRAGQTITPSGLGGEQALRVWTDVLAPATMSVDHPRYLAFIPGAPTEAATLFDLVLSVVVALRRQLARELRRRLRREPGAALDRRPGGHAGRGRRLLRAGRHGRQPVGAGGGPARACASGCGAALPPRLRAAVTDRDPQLRGLRAARRDGRRPAVGAGGRARPHDRPGAARGAGARGRRRRVRRRGHLRHHQPRRRRRPGRHRRGLPRARALVARRRRLRRRRAGRPVGAPPVRRHRARRQLHRRPAQVAVRARSTAARWSTATRRWRGARTPSTPATSTRSPTPASGTRPTTPSTCPAAPAGCRSGSRWPCTARDAYRDAIESTLEVARPRRRRDPQPPVPGAAGRARPVGADLQAGRAGRPRTTPPGRSGCSTRATPSSPPRRTTGEPCTRFAIVNPRTTVSDLTGILATMS